MTLICILLIIIAVGVLLASKAGQELLGCLMTLGLLVIVGAIILFVVVLAWEFFTGDTGKAVIGGISTFLCFAMCLGFLIFGVVYFVKLFKDLKKNLKNKKKKAIMWKNFKHSFTLKAIKTGYRANKALFILASILLLQILVMIVFNIIGSILT